MSPSTSLIDHHNIWYHIFKQRAYFITSATILQNEPLHNLRPTAPITIQRLNARWLSISHQFVEFLVLNQKDYFVRRLVFSRGRSLAGKWRFVLLLRATFRRRWILLKAEKERRQEIFSSLVLLSGAYRCCGPPTSTPIPVRKEVTKRLPCVKHRLCISLRPVFSTSIHVTNPR